jgi:hypothetical protein
MTTEPVQQVTLELFVRYAHILETTTEPVHSSVQGCGLEHLLWMCETARAQGPTWPLDKLSRWLGFVQGVMTLQGLLTVEGEREFTRPMFHAAYLAESVEVPASIGPENTLPSTR